jgi:hypothetical protein
MNDPMHTTKTRLTWIPAAHGMLDFYVAECGPYDFEIRSTQNTGYLLRMYRVRSEHSPRLVWARNGYGLEDAMERAERLADEYVPVITSRP